MSAYWLGLDVGTGGSRALLVDSLGQVTAGFTAAHDEMRMAQPLWAEQDPANWWEASQQAIRGVLAQANVDGTQIRAVGLTGQMHGLVLLDAQHQVIRPSLIWCDQRSQPQVDFINQTAGKQRVLQLTANPMLTGFTLPKLLWVRDHEPQNFARARKFLLPKDYLRFCLTGEFATDVSDASGTGLLDVVGRRWALDLVSLLGLDASLLPALVESTATTGKISAKAAEATGLAAGTPVVGGGGDQAASGVGNGIVTAGIASCTVGTSGVVFAHLDEPRYDLGGRVHTFCHAVPGKWHVMGVTQGAGLSLQWFRNQLAPDSSYDELTAEAALAVPGAQGLFWMPYLMGERTPHLDAYARGGWYGLTAKHTRADLVRAVLEGVTYSQKDCLNVLEEIGVDIGTVRLSGGGARSPFWRQMFADIFGAPVATVANPEGSAYGAALLAMTGTGVFATVEEACAATVRETETLEPATHSSASYQRRYEVYTALYPSLRPINGLIDALK